MPSSRGLAEGAVVRPHGGVRCGREKDKGRSLCTDASAARDKSSGKSKLQNKTGVGGFHFVTTNQNKTLSVVPIRFRSMKNGEEPPHPGLTVLTADGAVATCPLSPATPQRGGNGPQQPAGVVRPTQTALRQRVSSSGIFK